MCHKAPGNSLESFNLFLKRSSKSSSSNFFKTPKVQQKHSLNMRRRKKHRNKISSFQNSCVRLSRWKFAEYNRSHQVIFLFSACNSLPEHESHGYLKNSFNFWTFSHFLNSTEHNLLPEINKQGWYQKMKRWKRCFPAVSTSSVWHAVAAARALPGCSSLLLWTPCIHEWKQSKWKTNLPAALLVTPKIYICWLRNKRTKEKGQRNKTISVI